MTGQAIAIKDRVILLTRLRKPLQQTAQTHMLNVGSDALLFLRDIH